MPVTNRDSKTPETRIRYTHCWVQHGSTWPWPIRQKLILEEWFSTGCLHLEVTLKPESFYWLIDDTDLWVFTLDESENKNERLAAELHEGHKK